MKIKLINYYLFSVPVSFEISTIHIPYSRHIVVELEVDGKRAVGEGISYKSSLSQVEKYIRDININKINLYEIIAKEPGLAAAIDQAIIAGRGKGGLTQKLNYTKQVFIKPVSTMVDEIDALVKSKCKDIKLKLGRKVEDDIKLIQILKEKFPTINFKADVNCGYSKQEFIKVLKANQFFIKTWEEPVKKGDQKSLVDIKHKYKIKVMLDESVKNINELNFYIKENIIDILNIKLSRIGGLSKAKEYIKICEKNKIKISVGCSEELGIGMNAINQLAGSVHNVFGIEGIGSERLKFDITKNGIFDKGKLYKAKQKLDFNVFEKNKIMNFFDKLQEKKENIQAKIYNGLIKINSLL